MTKVYPNFFKQLLQLIRVVMPNIQSTITPLVQRMRATGVISPIAASPGWRKSEFGRAPFVCFCASVDVACQIEQILRTDSMSSQPALNTSWSIEARFNQAGELVFFLHAPWLNYRMNTAGLVWFDALFCRWQQNKLDADFKVLAEFFEVFRSKASVIEDL